MCFKGGQIEFKSLAVRPGAWVLEKGNEYELVDSQWSLIFFSGFVYGRYQKQTIKASDSLKH